MSPVYSYYHQNEDQGMQCPGGHNFDWEQMSRDLPLSCCPRCGTPVERGLAALSLHVKKFNCELKDMGFTKLARVDDGIYENLTRRPGEDKYIDRRNPQTFPDLSKTVKD